MRSSMTGPEQPGLGGSAGLRMEVKGAASSSSRVEKVARSAGCRGMAGGTATKDRGMGLPSSATAARRQVPPMGKSVPDGPVGLPARLRRMREGDFLARRSALEAPQRRPLPGASS